MRASKPIRDINRERWMHGMPLVALTVHVGPSSRHDRVDRRVVKCPWCGRNHAHYGLGEGAVIAAPCINIVRISDAKYEIVEAS